MEAAFINDVVRVAKDYRIDVKRIFDLGACDLDESLYLAEVFPEATVDAFEANPDKYEICQSRAGIRVRFWPFGVGSGNKTILYNIADDPRQSSVYDISSDRFQNSLKMDVKLDRAQKVEIIRLDSIGLQTPDLVFMDIQGSELDALIGMGSMLKDVKIIATELFLQPVYDSPLFDVVDHFLKTDFDIVQGNPFDGVFENFIYVNRRFL